MSAEQGVPVEHDVLFIEDVARTLRLSVRSIRRARAHGVFPIPELPALDKRPRWSREAVQKFLARQQAPVVRRWRKRA